MACNSQHFSGEQKTVLTRYFYDQNVQSTRKEYLEIIGKIANEIGSTPDKVKNWINAEKRRNKRKACSQVPEDIPESETMTIMLTKRRKLSGFQVFCHKQAGSSSPDGNVMKEFSQRWSQLDASEKASCSRKGHDIVGSCNKKQAIKKLITSTKENLQNLSKLGVEGYCLVINVETSDCQFLSSSSTVEKYIELEKEKDHLLDHDLFKYMCGESFNEAVYKKKKKKLSYDAMLEAIRHDWRDKYKTATGEGRIPYKSIDSMKCVVLGLPAGIKFQQPAEYNSKDLRCVFNAMDSIQFVNATDSN